MRKLFLAMVLFPACSPALERHSRLIGPETYAIDCGENAAECYEFALQRCPGGYSVEGGGTEVTGVSKTPWKTRLRRETAIVARCKPPVFCEYQACEYGTKCVASERYPGSMVCAVVP